MDKKTAPEIPQKDAIKYRDFWEGVQARKAYLDLKKKARVIAIKALREKYPDDYALLVRTAEAELKRQS